MGVSPKTYLQLLTVERTAGILGVSAATVRNWVRCGRIVPAARRPVMLSRVDVIALKKDILNHGFGLSIIEDICEKNDGSCQWIDNGDTFDSVVMLRYQ